VGLAVPFRGVRDQFLLEPGVVYLNHGSYGACPRPVFERYQHWQVELERQPDEFLGRRQPELLAEARGRLAAYVGCGADDIVFVPNATAGVNVAARSLRLEPGDEVLASDLEYGACDLLWERLCARAGATYVRAPIPLPLRSAEDVVEALFAAATDRTRVVFVSHVTSETALRLPVDSICRRAREAGLTTVVDGAHAPGHVPLDLAQVGADYYAGNCHKWLCAPKGAGFLYMRRERQADAEALIVGWGFGPDGTFLTRNEEQGTRDPSAYLTVPAAIDWQAENAWDSVRARCHELARAARSRLAELTGLEPLAPDSPTFFGQMLTAPLPDCDAEELQRRLYDEHRIEVPLARARNGRPTTIRVSFQAYNDESDLEALLRALRRLL
jgi:isopenicillin-N epimerase